MPPKKIALAKIACTQLNHVGPWSDQDYKIIDNSSMICKPTDHLKDSPRKNNEIRSVRKMMQFSSHNDLSSKQKELIDDIKTFFDDGKATDENIAAVLFDMKAMGDITQFEYFIDNLKFLTSFETLDTILLLFAIICVGEKWSSGMLTAYKQNRYLYFSTKMGNKIPAFYKFTIEQLNNIYIQMCEKIGGQHAKTEEEFAFALKLFARILDSCHDFLKDQRKESAEEEQELSVIEQYLNHIFTPIASS